MTAPDDSAPSPAPRRAPVRRPLWRLLPLVIGLGGAALVGYLYGPQQVELLVQVPPGFESVQGLDLRVFRAKDNVQVLTVRREKAAREGRTVVVPTKLPRGKYRVDAWPAPQLAPPAAFEAQVQYQGEESLEVPLEVRPETH